MDPAKMVGVHRVILEAMMWSGWGASWMVAVVKSMFMVAKD
jgi:hypothetical protein